MPIRYPAARACFDLDAEAVPDILRGGPPPDVGIHVVARARRVGERRGAAFMRAHRVRDGRFRSLGGPGRSRTGPSLPKPEPRLPLRLRLARHASPLP